MSGIRATDTSPEIYVRKELHKRGFRFRLHVKTIPGNPDLVLRRYRALIVINGCFWHGHDCRYFKIPGTRREFWLEKINGNRLRDIRTLEAQIAGGWRVLILWECAVRAAKKKPVSTLLPELISAWLAGDSQFAEIDAETMEGHRCHPVH